MIIFIKLTETDSDDKTSINVGCIEVFFKNRNGYTTVVMKGRDGIVEVKETPEEIHMLIAAACAGSFFTHKSGIN